MPSPAQTLWIGKIFLADVTIEAIILLILEIIILATVSETERTGTSPAVVYAVLLIVSLVFFLAFAWDAILNENSIQLFTFLFFSVMLTVYALVRFLRNIDQAVYIVEFVVLILGEVFLFTIAKRVFSEFGWRVYRKVGADPRTRTVYQVYLILITLVKMDFAVAIILVAQNVSLALEPDDYEFALNFVAIVFVIFYTGTVIFGVRKENTPAMILFFVLSPLEPAYIIFKLVRFTTVKGKGYEAEDFPLWQLMASGVFAVIQRIVVVFFAYKAFRNFGKGLLKYLGPGQSDAPVNSMDASVEPGSNLGSYSGARTLRMEDS